MVCAAAGQTFSDDDVRYMLRQFTDKDTVDFVSFALSLHSKLQDSRYHEAFGDAFDLFDTGMKGELSSEDLIDGMSKLGETMTQSEADEMIKIGAKVCRKACGWRALLALSRALAVILRRRKTTL